MSAIGRFLSTKKAVKRFAHFTAKRASVVATRRKGICHESDTHRKDSVATARNT